MVWGYNDHRYDLRTSAGPASKPALAQADDGGFIVTAPDFPSLEIYAPAMEDGFAQISEDLREQLVGMVYPPTPTNPEALQSEPLKWQVCTHLLIATGARRGEIMGLKWQCVDWKNKRLYLQENRVYAPETGAISTSLKTDENRYVSVSCPGTVKAVEGRTGCRILKAGDNPVWVHTDGRGRRAHAPRQPHRLAGKV